MLDRPSSLLRIEEAVILLATVFLYQHLHFSWLLFALLFFSPDLFMFGYLVNPRLGATTYNLAHNLFLPILLFLIAFNARHPLLQAIAIIWTSHIAFDRVLGYGLKYPAHFKDTHLQHLA